MCKRKDHQHNKTSSCECKKVVTDILSKIEFSVDYGSLANNSQVEVYPRFQFKGLLFCKSKNTWKSMEGIGNWNTKFTSPAKWQKCRYDFFAFTWLGLDTASKSIFEDLNSILTQLSALGDTSTSNVRLSPYCWTSSTIEDKPALNQCCCPTRRQVGF